ncbi:hypothetical protein PSM7751_01392 [Pseudooceanicola marinus]|uniref:DUF11 domain-containing protein n=1 Tax=Pseudooceanicola marinus TaxID=396013 RepID=A0A1X6YV18_9RHOB|nr:DUF11 domain-containing protein [Pseudooceanicola marinus]PJE26249.1 DUF11 domain-containing protein [Pseudooceanicola marinus]SLN31926.1 hypothetical protein PSM7751_01392 [Pseudooceanicola marinus]
MRGFLQTVSLCAGKTIRTAALISVLVPGTAAAAPAPAGTIIRNIAETTYFNPRLGIVETVRSNAVEALVTAVPDISVQGFTELDLSRGAIGQYYFEVANTGNTGLAATLRVEGRNLPMLTLDGRLVRDINGNGVIDSGDQELTATTQIALTPGDMIPLIYEFAVSTAAVTGQTLGSVLLVNATPDGAADAVLTGEASGRTEIVSAGLELEKLQTIRQADEDVLLEYTLRLRNNSEQTIPGYAEIDGGLLRIDGQAARGVLVRDRIPLNSIFHSVVSEGGMTPLYHQRGDGPNDFQRVAPAADEIDAVAFFHEGDFPVGRSSDPVFAVRVPQILGNVTVRNTAETYLGAEAVQRSNTTIFSQDGTHGGLLSFVDPTTGEDEDIGQPGEDSRLRLTAGACNQANAIETVSITLRSATTGDVETVIATETAANTGVFLTTAIPLARMNRVLPGDQVMATDNGDQIIATASCGEGMLEDVLLVSPGNFLFNSLTNASVEGGTIALVDAITGREIARTETDPRGFFAFGEVSAGDYRYVLVETPAWEYPSVRVDFAGFGRNVADAGYGAAFQHSGGALFVSDVPVDPHYGVPLALTKASDRDRISQGEFVTYTLTLSNNMDQALIGAELMDRPPYGAQLVEGSVTLDGVRHADPRRDAAGDLLHDLGTIEPLARHELSYVMLFTAAAREGRNENTAILSGRQAGTGTLRQSPLARAVVRLDNSGGVFAREGTVVGSVFMDCDRNGIRGGIDEPGIPGVRIVTQEGLSVVTDINGKYSLYGLRPVTHAFVVQEQTLPVGTAVYVTRTNDLRRGGSRIVPLRKGELRAEHFAVEACTPEALAEIDLRRDRFEQAGSLRSGIVGDLPIEASRAPVRASRSEAGIATTTQLTPDMLVGADAAELPETLPQKAAMAARLQPLDSLIRSLDNAPGFIDLAEGAVLSRRTVSIRIKGKADLNLSLLLNGRELGTDRVGERSSWEKGNVQALDYVAVKLDAGENRLTLVGRDGFGIERVREEIRMMAPGDPARFEIILPETAPANPASAVPVVVRVLDARGLPVPASGTVTLTARNALWDVTDIRPGTPGVQAYIDNGEATFNLTPPQAAGPDLLSVKGTFGEAEARITFTPDLDQRVLVGVIEGAVSLGSSGGGILSPDGFSEFEDTATGLRGEIYLKGVIRGDALLTLRYSSDRDTEDRLFRDIRGDEYYPVYGDNSERGADAQSSGNLFVKVEKGRSYVLYGDIAIEPEASAFKLGGLRRVTTGAKAHWENDRVSVTVFAARTGQEQMVVEIPGRGVSGPYDLNLQGYVDGSERVEIVVRDEEGGDILSSTVMRRGTDYLLDFFRDTITFDAPVRQFDADGNPVSIRVTYEVEETGSERYWLYGGEVNYAVTERTTIGARAVHADAPEGNPARERLQSAYLRHDRGNGGVWEAEVAHSEDENGIRDTAARLSYEFISETERLTFEAIHTGHNFSANGGLARPGTSQVRLSYGLELDRKSDLVIGAEWTRDRINSFDRLTLDALYSRRFSPQFRGDLGIEYQRDRRGTAREDTTSLILGAHWMPKTRPGTTIEARLRYPLSGQGHDPELTLGMYKEPKPGWRAYNEVELTFGDEAVITRSVLGFSYELNEWLEGSTELSRGANEIETTLNQSLMATWKPNDLTSFTLGVEHSRQMETNEHELTSVAFGAKWESGDGAWVGDADLETTFEPSGQTYYASLGLAGEVTPDLTVLGRTRLAVDQRNGEDHIRMRTRAGLAYRPVADPRLEVLAWYEHRLEERYGRSETHLWSVDASYEIDQDLRLNGKYAGQHQSVATGSDVSAASTTQLLQAGVNYEFGDDRFQIGLNATHLWDDRDSSASGLGAEFGFSPRKGTLLAVGYNKSNRSMPGAGDLYQEGFYLRFNLLLDTSLWDQLDGFLGN